LHNIADLRRDEHIVSGRLLPKDLPPFTTVQGYFYDWRDSGLFERINFELLLEVREAAGREASPSLPR
jgi:hypothetical protein